MFFAFDAASAGIALPAAVIDGRLADLLRLALVPAFGWAAYRDVRTRRVTNRLWPPLLAIGVVALALDALARWPFGTVAGRLFAVRVAVSLLVVAPLGYLFWRLGAFGGADAKAVIVLAVALPTYPVYSLPVDAAALPIDSVAAIPLIRTPVGVLSLTVLTNAVLVAAAYPLALGIRNALRGRRSPAMFFARVVPVPALPETHGRLFQTRSGIDRGGLDLDALRMYLRWRGATLDDIVTDPDGHRDPASVDETYPPTDGAVVARAATGGPLLPDGGDDGFVWNDGSEATGADGNASAGGDGQTDADAATGDATPTPAADDPWAAARFLDEIDGSAYGTDPETLREGLETLVAVDRVWVSPGLPFVVPLFLGLVVGLTLGDPLFLALQALGLT